MIIDSEARAAIWMAICDAASKLAGRCKIHISRETKPVLCISNRSRVPEEPTWKLVEALSLLAILMNADEVYCKDVFNIFGKTGPLHFMEDGHNRYLWAQYTLSGQESTLGGRPDIIVTSNQNAPTAMTTLRIIECKCLQRLGTTDIRAEFGKAYDLKVSSYFIWSFITPASRIIEGAKRLGLDVMALGFDTPQRMHLIARPENLVAHVANSLNMSKRERRFAQILKESGQMVDNKKMLE